MPIDIRCAIHRAVRCAIRPTACAVAVLLAGGCGSERPPTASASGGSATGATAPAPSTTTAFSTGPATPSVRPGARPLSAPPVQPTALAVTAADPGAEIITVPVLVPIDSRPTGFWTATAHGAAAGDPLVAPPLAASPGAPPEPVEERKRDRKKKDEAKPVAPVTPVARPASAHIDAGSIVLPRRVVAGRFTPTMAVSEAERSERGRPSPSDGDRDLLLIQVPVAYRPTGSFGSALAGMVVDIDLKGDARTGIAPAIVAVFPETAGHGGITQGQVAVGVEGFRHGPGAAMPGPSGLVYAYAPLTAEIASEVSASRATWTLTAPAHRPITGLFQAHAIVAVPRGVGAFDAMVAVTLRYSVGSEAAITLPAQTVAIATTVETTRR